MNFIDTVLAYGDGRSERLVGQVVRERSETVYVATKVPPGNGIRPAAEGVPRDQVFPAGYVRECAERSLRNLGSDSVDLLQLHVWNDEWTDRDTLLSEVHELRSDGKIRFFGISINEPPARERPEHGRERRGRELIPACREHGVGVLARVPLDEGGLTGRIRSGHRVQRRRPQGALLPRRPCPGGSGADEGDRSGTSSATWPRPRPDPSRRIGAKSYAPTAGCAISTIRLGACAGASRSRSCWRSRWHPPRGPTTTSCG